MFVFIQLLERIIEILAENVSRKSMFRLREVSSDFENAVARTYLPQHTMKVDIGLDDDNDLQTTLNNLVPGNQRILGIPLTLRIHSKAIKRSSLALIEMFAPQVTRIYFMDPAGDTSVATPLLGDFLFPRLKHLKVFSPRNQLYHHPSEAILETIQTVWERNARQIKVFEVKYETNRGILEKGMYQIPSMITVIDGHFQDFPTPLLEAAAKLSNLVRMEVFCKPPSHDVDAGHIIGKVLNGSSHQLRILSISYNPGFVHEVSTKGVYNLETCVLPAVELVHRVDSVTFKETFPNLRVLSLYKLPWASSSTAMSDQPNRIIKDLSIQDFGKMSDFSNIETLSRIIGVFRQVTQLTKLSVRFSCSEVAEIVLREVFLRCTQLKKVVIKFRNYNRVPVTLDLTQMLTCVPCSNTFAGRSGWPFLMSRNQLCNLKRKKLV